MYFKFSHIHSSVIRAATFKPEDSATLVAGKLSLGMALHVLRNEGLENFFVTHRTRDQR